MIALGGIDREGESSQRTGVDPQATIPAPSELNFYFESPPSGSVSRVLKQVCFAAAAPLRLLQTPRETERRGAASRSRFTRKTGGSAPERRRRAAASPDPDPDPPGTTGPPHSAEQEMKRSFLFIRPEAFRLKDLNRFGL